MLAYFPEIYPKEALYSVLARYHLHSGNVSVRTTFQELFSKSYVAPTLDMPNYISKLVANIPPDRKLKAEWVARNLTHLRYYTAYLPVEQAEYVEREQLRGNTDLHLKMGLNSSVVKRKTELHYCATCSEEMLRLRGELWWRLDHQLPGVLLCPTHGESLRRAGLAKPGLGRCAFVAATPDLCPPDGPKVRPPVGTDVQAMLLELARRSDALLMGGPRFCSYAEMTEFYRERLWNAGLMNSRNQVSVERFNDAFSASVRPTLDVLHSEAFGREIADGAWLLEMARKQTRMKHPLQHLLLDLFLDSRPARSAPFGLGPWACPNKVANHKTGSLSILTVHEKRSGNGIIGTFVCECGYSYTMTARDDGRISGPRYKEFGPLLDPALTRLVARGCTLRGAAKALGLHPRGVAQAAARLGLNTGWKATSSPVKRLGMAVHPPRKPRTRNPKRRATRPGAVRVNWAERDRELSILLMSTIQEIRLEVPPVRVTVSEIERRALALGYLSLRRAKLPETFKVIDALLEDTREFQLRRLEYQFDRFCADGVNISPSRLLRAACLRSEWRETAVTMIHHRLP